MSAQQGWFFVDGGGQQVGPMSVEDLQGHVSNGMVAEHTLVWSEGMTDWLPASTIEGLFAAPAPTLQQPAQQQPQVHQPQINLGSSPATQAAPAQVNPYSTPQANLGAQAGGQAKPGFWNVLFSFEGRIPRRVYWGYSILMTLAFYALVFAAVGIFGAESGATSAVTLIGYVPVVWASLALQVKRWHDRDKSGWWVFIGFIPLVGGIWAFVECGCLRGTFGLNSYGEDPT